MRRFLLMAGCLAVLTAGGCGSADERARAATAVATRLLQAVAGHDGAAACALLAPDTAAKLAEQPGPTCAEAIVDEDLPAAAPGRGADVYGQWAQVRLTDDTIFLAAFPGGWRVVAAGCRPQGQQPYDCALGGR